MRILEFIGYVVESIAVGLWRTRIVQGVRFWWIIKSEDSKDYHCYAAIAVLALFTGFMIK